MEIIKDAIKKIKISEPLFLPFYNLWNEDVYYLNEPFKFNPFTIRSNSTSGSPVIVGDNFFAGFLNNSADSEFTFDGNFLTIDSRGAQECFFEECENPLLACEVYNIEVSKRFAKKKELVPNSLSAIEYCTWVEQVKSGYEMGHSPRNENKFKALNDSFIDNYIDRIENMNLPKGVLTLDHGWMEGSPIFDFRANKVNMDNFPDLSKTISRIKDAGFIPGLWFAPCFLYSDHELFKSYPSLKGSRFSGANEGGFDFPVHYFNVADELREIVFEYFRKLFTPYIQMGVRKLKIDFMYNAKNEMIKILRELYRAVKSIDANVEVESHIPDIYATPYQDAVRLNDVAKPNIEQQRALIKSHYLVSKYSAHKTQLNLDHIGTNDHKISEEAFIDTIELFKEMDGYPVVSLLPDGISKKATDALRDYLLEYETKKYKILKKRLNI